MSTLLLLVGANGLPNYITVKYLFQNPPKTGGDYPGEVFDKIYLLHSKKYNNLELKNLMNAISDIPRLTGYAQDIGSVKSLVIDDISDFARMKQRIEDVIKKEDEIVHLHYTGGRRTIGVQARAAIEELEFLSQKNNNKKFAEIHYSYLDPEAHKLLYDNTTRPNSKMLMKEIQVELEELATVQGWKIIKSSNEKVAEEVVDEKFNRVIRQSPQYEADELVSKLGKIEEEAQPILEEVEKFRRQKWLHYHVYNRVLNFARLNKNHKVKAFCDLKLSRENNGENFVPEYTFLALQGYQLTYFVCPVTADRGEILHYETEKYKRARREIKGYAFEALHRAKQLGGSEARVVLISLDYDIQNLQQELSSDFRGEDFSLIVWGYQDLRNLDFKIAQLFPDN